MGYAKRTTKVIDAAGHDVECAYDANGQLTKKTYADGSYGTMTYNSVGQLIGARDAKGNVAAYDYDTAGRLTKIDYPHDTDVTMSYDALGRLSSKTDGLGTTEYSYDTLNRLLSEDGPWENDTISYSYDALGRQTVLSINGSTQAAYSYDAFNRLTQVAKGTQQFGYSYNGASSQLTQMTLPGGAKTEYSYDAMQHLTQVQSLKSDGTTNLAKFDYSYNTRDVRTSVEKQIGVNTAQTINYTYDTTDQLTKELSTETTPLLNKEYSYDAMGNRITSSASGASTSYTSNNLNQITQTTVDGNNTALTYDANGNTIQQGNKTFGYNDADQLTSVVIPNQKKSEFVYDSDGRKRISKEYTWQNGAWVQSDETRFIYDGMDLVQERGADGTVKASYVRDGNIGGILSMTNADGTFTYHYDGSGNVVALTDANQNIVAQYSYDAFGNTLSASGAQAEKNPFRFSSKYFDGETGLYDFGFRHYDSSLGRWINRDPIREDGGLNLYGMVANNPINADDPYGLNPIGDAKKSADEAIARRFVSPGLQTQLLHHYIWGSGKFMTLNKWQVLNLIKPQTSLLESDKFRDIVRNTPNGSCSGEVTFKWYDFSKNGGLGHYSITAAITIDKSANGQWTARGTARVSDLWDFNWSWKEFASKEWKRGLKTALGSTISGDPFWVYSQPSNISQSSSQKYTTWK